jgi:hypothetical protein
MPRFVVLEHDHPELHWDLLLEVGEVLWAWRLRAPPGPAAVPAERSFDHRLIYLDYEGPVSGNRGTVQRWAHGEYVWREQGERRLVADVTGPRLTGRLVLEASGEAWRVTLEGVTHQ